MKIRTSLFAAGAAMALALLATPVNAGGTITETFTTMGTVQGDHHLESVQTLPDSVTFFQEAVVVYDCNGGPPTGTLSVKYSGAFIEGQNGIYIHLAQFWIGNAAGHAGSYEGIPTVVWFSVQGENGLGLHHSFSGQGTGIGSRSSRMNCGSYGGGDAALGVPPAFRWSEGMSVDANLDFPPAPLPPVRIDVLWA